MQLFPKYCNDKMHYYCNFSSPILSDFILKYIGPDKCNQW